MNQRKLGTTQQDVLRAMETHGGWWSGCGWVWNTESGTARILDTLVARGLVAKTEEVARHGLVFYRYALVKKRKRKGKQT